MKKRVLIPLIIFAIAIIIIIIYSSTSEAGKTVDLTTEVEQGDFEIIVIVTGELQAEREVEILAPTELRSRNLRIRSVKIQDLIAEGTVVDSGDWVATLDRSELDNSLKDRIEELEQAESDYVKARIDTSIQLRQLRDDLINLRFNVEEMEINLEQSQFEPPATIRQAKINLDKAERAYEQALQNYDLKVQQAKADMTDVSIELAQERRAKKEMEEVLEKFVVYAPAPGMVIYKKEWGGQKRTVGSEINTWDLAVATLPDLSTLISQTYVNEIDISKIKRSQPVRIGVDAFPEKKFTGTVINVANIGEQLPNTDAKVFEIDVRINERDTILKPSMTTSNKIIIDTFSDVKYIPLESVHTNDSLTFVYTKAGDKQVVVLGASNENFIIVEEGLEKGEQIYLSLPEDQDKFKYKGLELMEVIKKRKLEEEMEQKEEEQPREIRKGRPEGNLQGQRRRTTE